MTTYLDIKMAVLDVIDDFAKRDDIQTFYGSRYTSKTKLDSIGLTDPVRAIMPKRVNKVMRGLAGVKWKPLGSIDLVSTKTISELIVAVCGQAGVSPPSGEPT